MHAKRALSSRCRATSTGSKADVTPDAEGEYECTGSNKYGQAKGAAKLLVRKAPRLEPFRRPEEVRIAGETIGLPCEATPDD
ncbi:hypothetical protein ANCCAN_11474, partial [Ancylostoma caninum]